MYRCVATTKGGFVQQLAVQYVAHGYWFYVVGSIPEGKEPCRIDEKLAARYDAGLSKWQKARRRQQGIASVQYLRHGRRFLILATHGVHKIFDEERNVLRDVRRAPIRCFGYAVGYRGGHVSVRIDDARFKSIKRRLLRVALRVNAERLGEMLRKLPFEPYAPVRAQLHSLLRAVNRVRLAAGLAQVGRHWIRSRRRIYRPFGVGTQR